MGTQEKGSDEPEFHITDMGAGTVASFLLICSIGSLMVTKTISSAVSQRGKIKLLTLRCAVVCRRFGEQGKYSFSDLKGTKWQRKRQSLKWKVLTFQLSTITKSKIHKSPLHFAWYHIFALRLKWLCICDIYCETFFRYTNEVMF